MLVVVDKREGANGGCYLGGGGLSAVMGIVLVRRERSRGGDMAAISANKTIRR